MLHAHGLATADDRIAVVGIGCLLPGGIESPDALWEFLRRGGDAVIDVPPDRWNMDAVYDPAPGTPGKTVSRRAGLLHDVVSFDAGFFGISPREAAGMDPQQRFLLEVTWRALEDAGIPAEKLAGSNTGVYVGISRSDYDGIARQVDVHTVSGGALSIAANRLSHRFDLRGPSLAIDTACSSSLVALDAACTALRIGECEIALAGGANALLTADLTIMLSRAAMLSPDGRCAAFDARANGYVRGEGASMVILKPLARALRDGDRIHAVIRGTAVNQDGRTNTITVPSRDAQVAMLRQACARADVHPSEIDYVEAHGTGTAVGDPIEADAIGSVFGEGRMAQNACVIGSIKTNIGHLESAAGIAGLIKAVLCVREGAIPAHLHFHEPNPQIDFAALHIRVPRELMAWPSTGRPRMAAINSFGFGGTNACAIVEQPPQLVQAICNGASADWRPALIPVSAASKSGLATVCTRLAQTLEEGALAFADVVGTLALRRSHLDHRLVVMAKSADEAAGALRGVAAGRPQATVASGRRSGERRLVFVFSGQGSQWWAMGRGLLQQDRRFRAAVERCDALFRRLSGWSLIEQLMQPMDSSRISETIVAQPVIFALQVALAERLAAWGIRPQAVVGHSIGEIAAAHVAGALSLTEAIDVVYHRSRLQERSRLQGAMAAIGLAAEPARAYLEKFDGQIEVAAINGPELISVAGPRALLDRFVAEVGRERSGVLCRTLQVDYAFHSRQMDPFIDELRHNLGHLQPRALDVAMFSSVSGEPVVGEQLHADYWCRNMRQPVLFRHAVDQAIDSGFDAFLELGAHPSLVAPIRACLGARGREGLAIGTLHREHTDAESITTAIASLHVEGVPVDWTALVPQPWKFVDLFGHPWEKQAHWAELEESRVARLDGPPHPLFERRVAATEAIWQCEIDANSPHYLQDHRMEGAVVFPAAGYIEMICAAARETLGEGPYEIETLSFHEALLLNPEVPTVLETSVDRVRGIVKVLSRHRGADTTWVLRASGRIRRWPAPAPAIEPWMPAIEPPIRVGQARFYRDLAEEGHIYGPAFQGVESIWYAEGCAFGKIVLPASITDAKNYLLHPARLDACLQVIRGFHGFGTSFGATMAIPLGIGRLRLFGQPSRTVFARADLTKEGATELVARLSIIDDTGRLVATIDDFRCLRIARSENRSQDIAAEFYRERWRRLPARVAASPEKPGEEARGWLILADRGGVAETLARLIVERGGQVALVFKAPDERRICEDRYEAKASAASLRRAMAATGRPTSRVICLWTLDESALRPTAATVVRARRIAVDGMAALARALAGQPVTPRLWVVTAGAVDEVETPSAKVSILYAGLTGFLRSLANEHPEYRPTLLDLDPTAMSAADVLDEILVDGDETEIVLRNGGRFGPRIEPVAENELPPRRRRWDARARAPCFRVAMSVPGVIENLMLVAMNRPEPQPGEVVIEVHAIGLNFRDVVAAMGLLPPGAEEGAPAVERFGVECAGIVVAVGEGVDADLIGQHVGAAGLGRCMASHVAISADYVFPIPRGMAFAAAAAVPTAFITAHYGLLTLGRLKPGERVLIHSAAGGVGLAAVSIAQAAGAEIFATAGSREKRLYLYRRGVEHVFDSRSPAFADAILWKSGGRGVDVVLNSLPSAFLENSLSVLAPSGRFIEIGKRDIYADSPLGLHALRNNGAFFALDVMNLLKLQPTVVRAEIDTILAKFACGKLQLMPVTVFPVSRVTDAFRRMTEEGHIGKVVLSLDDTEAAVYEREDAQIEITADATYLVTGGTRGLGLETARWLVDNGARSLVLVGRSDILNAEAQDTLKHLRSAGAVVSLVKADIARRAGVKSALAAAACSGLPLRGIVHAAGTIEDALVGKLRGDQIRRVFDGKVLGAWYLHELTRSQRLDFFVLYSSVAAMVGTPGQTHYAAANCMLDAIAAIRRARGLPGTSIAFGPIGDRGYLAQRPEVAGYVSGLGIECLPVAALLAGLAAALRHASVNATYAEINWPKLAQSLALIASSARTSALLQRSVTNEVGSDRQVRTAIVAAQEAHRPRFVADYLRGKVAAVLKVESALIEVERPLHEIGFDSLTAFELKNRVESELGITLPVGQFLQRPTISALVPTVIAAISNNAGGAVTAVQSDGRGPSMSIGQEALWFIDRLDPGNPAYGLAACVSFRPHVNDDDIDRIIQNLLVHNESLRFAFPSDGLGPVPILLPPRRYKLIRHDAAALSDAEFSSLLHAEANRSFHVEEGPLTRLHLFRRSGHDVILLQFHHIVADAASIAIMLDDVLEAYFALQAGLPLPPARQLAHFGHFVTWQRALVAGPHSEEHKAYWRQQLAGAPPCLPLATDRQRSLNPLGPGQSRNFIMRGALVEEIKGLARAEGTTLFSVLLAAFNVLLHRLTDESDIIVGIPVSGRTQPEFERMVGYLVNALPIRTRLSGGQSFQKVLAEVHATVRSSLEHQDYPFSMIVHDLDPPREPGRLPIFQVMFGMERFDSTDRRGLAAMLLNVTGLAIKYREFAVESVAVARNRAPFDMTFTIEEFDNQIFGVVDYRCDLWQDSTIEQWIDHYLAILHQIAACPSRSIAAFSLGSSRPRPIHGRELHDRPDVLTSLSASAAAAPDAIALTDAFGEMSYRSLRRRVRRLAGALAARAIGVGTRVGICLPRTSELPVAMLATLSTGAAYVPLDPSYPKQRLAAIIEDVRPSVVIVDRHTMSRLPAGAPVLFNDAGDDAPERPVPSRAADGDLAYIIHTSGSTGRPIGVEIERGALANLLAAMRAELPLSPHDTLLAVTPYSFDIAALELLLPLTIGARLVVADETMTRDGAMLSERLAHGDITILQATPATWEMLIESGWHGNNGLQALCGGEALSSALAARILARVKSLWNLYGPTEATIWSTLAPITNVDGAIPIGHPIANTVCLVVDGSLKPVGAGIVGELLIGGAGLARGYHNDPVRTAERFVADPLVSAHRWFRTGDLVRAQSDGTLQFLGRRDQQVKIRGFRIELGEIEAVLRKHACVRNAVVLAVGDDLLNRRLTAFVETSMPIEIHELEAHLRDLLPRYMIPDVIELVAAIPRLPNGKIDRRHLAARVQLPASRVPRDESIRARSPVEAQLQAILEELLGRESIGLDDDFFSLGGTSLLGMRYIKRINEVYGIWFGATDLMRAPTVASMAQVVTASLTRGGLDRARALGPSQVSPLARRLWRPLPMLRAEGAFDQIDAAAIAYLPDDARAVARLTGAERSLLRRLPHYDDPQWAGVCHLSLGSIALLVIPRFGLDLVAQPDEAVRAVNAAIDYAVRLGARTIALTGLIPAVTDFGRALKQRQGVAITTGHATTASAIVLTATSVARAAQRNLQEETIAFVGVGAIGAATLRLMLARAIRPPGLILSDVPAKAGELDQLAQQIRAEFQYDGKIEVALASGAPPDEVYRSRFVIGATNVPGVLDVERLSPGTVVVDDSFPHCFQTDRAIDRMVSHGDVLLVDGGLVSPPGTIQWTLMPPPPSLATVLGDDRETRQLPDASAITACILSSLLTDHYNAAATTGPVTVRACLDHWEMLERMGIGVAPLRCASWSPPDGYLRAFGGRTRASAA
jgi:amino acid adenylation domain-containing protein